VKLDDECTNCILKRADRILQRNQHPDPSKILDLIELKFKNLNNQQFWISNYLCPAQLGTIRNQVLADNNIIDLYTEERKLGMKLGKTLFERYFDRVSLNDAIMLALLGNGIEFDIAGNEKGIIQITNEIENDISKLHQDIYFQNTIKQVSNWISQLEGTKVTYLLDNVGEHFLDALLMHELIKKGWKIDVIVKGSEVLNDVTNKEMEEFPLEITIHKTNNNDVGLFLSRISPKLFNLIQSAELLIIKGMAMFESLSPVTLSPPTLFLLKAKCLPVANITGVELNDYVIHYQENTSWLH